MKGSVKLYVPSITMTRTGFVIVPIDFKIRIASRAPPREATGPSVRCLFGRASRPDHWSLPLVETYKVRASAH